MNRHYEIAIIGAGPAGMAAAIELSHSNTSTVLFDEHTSPGGQVYRASDSPILPDTDILGQDYAYGSYLIEKFRQSTTDYLPSSTVWQISKELEIGVSREGHSHLITAGHVIIATGAIERPFPVPGWTLPGVSTIGSAQILLKTAGMVEDDAVLIGAGPLLYLLASQYLHAGVTIKAILDTNPKLNKWKALKHLPFALKNLNLITKGRKWLSEIKKSNIQFHEDVSDIELHGEKQVSSVTFKAGNRQKFSIKAERVFLHQGVTPNTNLAMAVGCKHKWDPLQLSWRPHIKSNGKTHIPGLWIAGDGSGIIGAKASEAMGHITANAILVELKKAQSVKDVSFWAKTLSKERSFRPFIDTLFLPRANLRIPNKKETIVCRCEEITSGEIKNNIALGCIGPNQLKAFCRAGMGPCQGRFCGLTVSEMIADQLKMPVPEVGYYRVRPPIKPLTLRELATLNETT
jgi:thioredoxin reductase